MKKFFSYSASVLKEGAKTRRKIFISRVFAIAGTALLLTFMMVFARAVEFSQFNLFTEWKTYLTIIVLAILTTIIISTLFVYSMYINDDTSNANKILPIMSLAIIITYVLAIVFARLINIYVVPLTLLSLLIASLIDKRVGIATNVLMSQAFFLSYVFIYGTDMTVAATSALITSIVSACFLIIYVDKARTRVSYIVAGIVVAVCTAVIPMLINLISVDKPDAYTILMSGMWSFVSVILSVALYMLILPIMEVIYRVDTPFRLSELSSLDSPLLKRLAKEAPGTFSHSMSVAALSELCADAIGESSQLARACAYYHDVGKLKDPEYFIENQTGYNPHDDVIPEVSVSMIVSHVTAGYEMIKAAHLPDIIADVALEHHGTTPVNYFLYKAQNYTEEDVNDSEFRYPGPKPKSKISAIIMIVDTVEAATRANKNTDDPEKFREFVRKLIKSKIDAGQFSECDISFGDLGKIEDILVRAIPSMHHERIKYDIKKKA